jgi:hypothetical protein
VIQGEAWTKLVSSTVFLEMQNTCKNSEQAFYLNEKLREIMLNVSCKHSNESCRKHFFNIQTESSVTLNNQTHVRNVVGLVK